MSEKTTKLQHDTEIHVAQFLQEGIGTTRQARTELDRLPLDGDLVAQRVTATVKLMRIPTGILARGAVQAAVTVECIRCLEPFVQPVEAEFADEYRPTVNIMTGADVALSSGEDDEDEYFEITDVHILDFAESLRQALVLGLPMAPLCRDDCPGLPEAQAFDDDGDARLAVLARLLGDDLDAGADDRRSQRTR